MFNLLAKRERLLFFAASGLLVGVMVFQFVISPLAEKNATLNADIQRASSRLSRYLSLIDQSDLIESSYDQTNPLVGSYKANGDPAVEALSELEFLARKARVQILEMRPETRRGRGPLSKKLLIDLLARGRAEGFLRFSYHLGSSPYRLKVEKCRITSGSADQFLEGEFLFSASSEPE